MIIHRHKKDTLKISNNVNILDEDLRYCKNNNRKLKIFISLFFY